MALCGKHPILRKLTTRTAPRSVGGANFESVEWASKFRSIKIAHFRDRIGGCLSKEPRRGRRAADNVDNHADRLLRWQST